VKVLVVGAADFIALRINPPEHPDLPTQTSVDLGSDTLTSLDEALDEIIPSIEHQIDLGGM
jgi:hypothetical protein